MPSLDARRCAKVDAKWDRRASTSKLHERLSINPCADCCSAVSTCEPPVTATHCAVCRSLSVIGRCRRHDVQWMCPCSTVQVTTTGPGSAVPPTILVVTNCARPASGAPASGAGPLRFRRAAGHRPDQRPVPDRLHRIQRRAAGDRRRTTRNPSRPTGTPTRSPTSADPRTRFCTDGRYTTQSAGEVPDLPRLIARPCDRGPAARGRRPAASVSRPGRSPSPTYDALQAVGRPEAAGRRPADHPGRGRGGSGRSRTHGEIDALRRACAVADQALADLIDGGRHPARPHRAGRSGSTWISGCANSAPSDPSFETIVAAGAEQRHPAPPADRGGAGRRVTSSSSTSARPSTATTRT